jgi:membrane-bound lytic murein transglycosylase B
MMRPYEAKPWYIYRKHFIHDELINSGVRFWNDHQKTLQLASTRYGVPPNLIVAIIGVESHYGQNTGHYRVMDTLATLAFQPNPRTEFFRSELSHFLLLCREAHWDPLAIEGSYAGAIGAPQFMPSSYRHYAIAFKQGQFPDLIDNMDDAIMSVANYLHQYGWHADELIHLKATPSKQFASFLKDQDSSRKPEYTVRELKKKGLAIGSVLNPKTPVGIIKLAHENWDEYRLGFRNFYVITRYNTSIQYAMAVAMLGAEINTKHTPPKPVVTKKQTRKTNNKAIKNPVGARRAVPFQGNHLVTQNSRHPLKATR